MKIRAPMVKKTYRHPILLALVHWTNGATDGSGQL
jgi:hypothetical protein